MCAKEVTNETVKSEWRFDLIMSPPSEEWINRRHALRDIADLSSDSPQEFGTWQHVPDDISFARFVAKTPQGPGQQLGVLPGPPRGTASTA